MCGNDCEEIAQQRTGKIETAEEAEQWEVQDAMEMHG